MKKYLFLMLVLLALVSQVSGQSSPVRIRMPDSTYSAVLVGVAGTRTAGDSVTGAWSTYYRMHEFSGVATTGRYKLYVDAAGGTTYTLVSTWGGTYGKVVAGYDLYQWMERLNANEEVLSIGLGDTSVHTDKIKNAAVTEGKIGALAISSGKLAADAVSASSKIATGAIETSDILDATILQADVADSQISLAKMTTAAINYIDAAGGGSITNNPDDVTLENKGGSTIGLKDAYKFYAKQGTVSGNILGNARGTNATDFQLVRASNSQVASAARSFIAGGRNNTVASEDAFTSGYGNYIANFSARGLEAYAAHSGGYNNTVYSWYGHAEGSNCFVDGLISHAEGNCNIASANDSHVEGNRNVVGRKMWPADSYGVDDPGLGIGNRAYVIIASSYGDVHAYFPGTELADTSGARIEALYGAGAQVDTNGNAYTSGLTLYTDLVWALHTYCILRGSDEVDIAHKKILLSSYNAVTGTKVWYDTTASAFNSILYICSSYSPQTLNGGSGNGQHVEGKYNSSWGNAAHAEGQSNHAWAERSHAEGYGNTVTGANSHVEGKDNTNSGTASHVQGDGNSNTGTSAHVQGATNINSGNYSFVGGYDNVNTAESALIGCYENDNSGNYSAITGRKNKNSGLGTFVTGYKDTNTANYSFQFGYDNNNTAHYSFTGGYGNTNSGANSFLAGYGNTNSGTSNFLAGQNNSVTGEYSFASGLANSSTNYYTNVSGFRADAPIFGQKSWSMGRFAANGDAQTSEFIYRATTTNATETELRIDGSYRATLKDSSAVFVTAYIIATRTDSVGNQSAAYELKRVIDRRGGASTTAVAGALSKTVIAEDDAAWDCTLDCLAGTTGSIYISATGKIGSTIRWVAHVKWVEVRF